MDSDILVETKVEDGQKLIQKLNSRNFSVAVAFWGRRSQESLWRFWIASPAVDPLHLGDALGIVYAAMADIPYCSVTPSETSLLSHVDSIARDAIILRDRNRANGIKWYRVERLGTMEVEDLGIYSRTLPFPTRELPDGTWQVKISEHDDIWLTCDSKDDAITIAAAPELRDHALERVNTNGQVVNDLMKTADTMQKYRMGFGSRFLRGLAENIQETRVHNH